MSKSPVCGTDKCDLNYNIPLDDTPSIYKNLSYSNNSNYAKGNWPYVGGDTNNQPNEFVPTNGYITKCLGAHGDTNCSKGYTRIAYCNGDDTSTSGDCDPRSGKYKSNAAIKGGNESGYASQTGDGSDQCGDGSHYASTGTCYCNWTARWNKGRGICKRNWGDITGINNGNLAKNIHDAQIGDKGMPPYNSYYLNKFPHTTLKGDQYQADTNSPMYVWNTCCKTKLTDKNRNIKCPIGYHLISGNVNTADPSGKTNPRDGRFDSNKNVPGQENYGNAQFSDQCQALMVTLPIGDISKGMDSDVKESQETINSKKLDTNGTGIGGPCAITNDTDLEKYMESECVTIGLDSGDGKSRQRGWISNGKNTNAIKYLNITDSVKKSCLAPYPNPTKSTNSNLNYNPQQFENDLPFKDTFFKNESFCSALCNNKYKGLISSQDSVTNKYCVSEYNEESDKQITNPSFEPGTFCKSNFVISKTDPNTLKVTSGPNKGKFGNRARGSWYVNDGKDENGNPDPNKVNYDEMCGCLYPDEFYQDYKDKMNEALGRPKGSSFGQAKKCYYTPCQNASIPGIGFHDQDDISKACPNLEIVRCVNENIFNVHNSVINNILNKSNNNCGIYNNSSLLEKLNFYISNSIKTYGENINKDKKLKVISIIGIVIILSIIVTIILII